MIYTIYDKYAFYTLIYLFFCSLISVFPSVYIAQVSFSSVLHILSSQVKTICYRKKRQKLVNIKINRLEHKKTHLSYTVSIIHLLCSLHVIIMLISHFYHNYFYLDFFFMFECLYQSLIIGSRHLSFQLKHTPSRISRKINTKNKGEKIKIKKL